MADLTPKISLKKPVPNVELDWAFRLNESLDILDGVILSSNLSALGNVTYVDLGNGQVTISGNELIGKGGIQIAQEPTRVLISGAGTVTKEPTGFVNLVDSDVAFNESNRTFSIWPTTTGGAYEYWIQGSQYFGDSTLEVQISDVDGLHAIYLTPAGTLADDTTIMIDEIIKDNAYVALLSWNVASGTLALFGEERHGLTMDWATHEYLHTAEGARYIDGLGTGNFTTTGDGSADSHAQLSIDDGRIADEDLFHSITDSAAPSAPFEQILDPVAEIPVIYRDGASGDWNKVDANTFPVKQGTSTIQFNEFTGGSWATTDVDDGDYVFMWIFGTHNRLEPVIAVLGQSTVGPLAYLFGVREDFGDLDLENFPTPEARVLWRVAYEADSAFTNTPAAAIREVSDFRQVPIAAVAGTAVDHGSLSGLLDDDHPQYVIGDGSRESSNVTITGSLNIPQYSTDPTVADGDLWINTTTSGLRWRMGGVTFEATGSAV